MSATDELRRMLTDAGVEYRWDSGTVTWYIDGVMYNAWGFDNERLTMSVCYLTPAQAIAATVGDTDATPTRQDGVETCHVMTIGEFNGEGTEYYDVCSNCGYEFDDDPLNYCPNCGRRVVAE